MQSFRRRRVSRGFSPDIARRLNGTADPRIPELAVMADVLNPEQVENTPLNTDIETPTLEAAADHSGSSNEPTPNPEATTAQPAEHTPEANAESDDADFGSMEDFAAALESFDREQAAAEAASQAVDD